MVEILVGPSMLKRLWRKLFPKKVNTTATIELDPSQASIGMGIPDWVRKLTLKDSRKPVINSQTDPPQNDITIN